MLLFDIDEVAVVLDYVAVVVLDDLVVADILIFSLPPFLLRLILPS